MPIPHAALRPQWQSAVAGTAQGMRGVENILKVIIPISLPLSQASPSPTCSHHNQLEKKEIRNIHLKEEMLLHKQDHVTPGGKSLLLQLSLVPQKR